MLLISVHTHNKCFWIQFLVRTRPEIHSETVYCLIFWMDIVTKVTVRHIILTWRYIQNIFFNFTVTASHLLCSYYLNIHSFVKHLIRQNAHCIWTMYRNVHVSAYMLNNEKGGYKTNESIRAESSFFNTYILKEKGIKC